MKQANIQITFEEEKLRALRRYIAKRDSTLEAELQKAAQRLYEKVVPAGDNHGTVWRAAKTPCRIRFADRLPRSPP